MTDTINIYHILDHYIPLYSGYTFRTRYILDFEKKMGLNPSVIISPKHSGNLQRHETIDDISCFRSQLNGLSRYKTVPFLREKTIMWQLEKDILKTVDKKPNTIIHAHSPVLCGIPALTCAKKLRIPVIYHVRALWEDAAVDQGTTKAGSIRYCLTRYLETSLLRKVDGIITICEGLKKELVSRKIDPGKINILPNCVDTDKFVPRDREQQLVKKLNLGNKTVIGFIGSFYKYEGLYTLIRSIKEILSKNKNITLLLVGKGEEEKRLKKETLSLGLNDSVIFTGQVPHQAILDYYSVIDILVYPRDKIRLTDLVTPLKPLEAMSMEKPVIGSTAEGIKELITDGYNGLLFESGNHTDLAKKVLLFTKDSRLKETCAKNAREYVCKHRNWETAVRKNKEIYTALLENRNAENN